MSNPWLLSLLVGCGGFLGSLARYGLSLSAARLDISWPLGTLSANVLGCLAIGIIMTLSLRGSIAPEVRLALATGFCGGFTTMSSMMYETAEMLRSSEYLHAGLYAAGTLVLSLLAYVLGVISVRYFLKMGGALWS